MQVQVFVHRNEPTLEFPAVVFDLNDDF